MPRVPARATRPAARRSRGARSRRASTQDELRRRRARATAAATTTSSGGSSSRSPTRAAACAASRRASSTTTTRCRRSTSTRPRASSSRRATCSTGSTPRAQAIAKEDRAVVVEGNTDVLALRQAGFQPVVASMGTALTEQQLRRARRGSRGGSTSASTRTRPGRTRRCAGWSSRSRRASTCRIVALPKGTDPADDPAAFERQLAVPVSYLVHRVRLLHERARRQERSLRRDRDVPRTPSPTRPSVSTRGGSPPTSSTCRPRRRPLLPRVAARRGRRALAAAARRGARGSSAARSPASRRTTS